MVSRVGDWISLWMAQAKDNPLGLIALGIALIAGLSFQFLRREDWRVRLAWLAALLVALCALVWFLGARRNAEAPTADTNFYNLNDDALLQESARKFKPYARTIKTSAGTGTMWVNAASTDNLSLTISAKIAYDSSGCKFYPAMCDNEPSRGLALPSSYIQKWLCAPYTDSRAMLDRGIPITVAFKVTQDGQSQQELYQVECNQ